MGIYENNNRMSDGSYYGGEIIASVATPFNGIDPNLNPIQGGAVQQNQSRLNYTPGSVTTTPSKRQVKSANRAARAVTRAENLANFKNSAKDYLKTNGVGLASSAVDFATSFIKTQEEKGKNPTGFQTQQKIGDALTKVPIPIVQAAGVAYKALSAVSEATGGNTNTITKDQAEDIGISKGTRLLNNIVGTLHPGAGWFVDKIEEGQKSHLIDEMSNAYADTVADIDQAGVLGGGKYLFGSKKVANAVQEANRRNELLTEMNMTNTMRKQSDYGRDLAQQNLNRYAGTNYMDMRMGKQGMKFPELDSIRELLNNRVSETDIQKFADGGSILPVGSRHKNLNHLSEINPELGDLTRKGIPVVTLNEGGEIEQIAEIECNEWTLSKSLTDQIEALWKDGSEEAMIECGKIVCEELLRNTKDEGGLLDE